MIVEYNLDNLTKKIVILRYALYVEGNDFNAPAKDMTKSLLGGLVFGLEKLRLNFWG